jgi:deoxyribonuclease V
VAYLRAYIFHRPLKALECARLHDTLIVWLNKRPFCFKRTRARKLYGGSILSNVITMILAVDVAYKNSQGFTAGIAFDSFNDSEPKNIYKAIAPSIQNYEPGKFYKRELPCILQLLNTHSISPRIIIVDGYVKLGENRKGLGMHLYEALNKKVIVIGVAKNEFKGADGDAALYRKNTNKPIFISSSGISLDDAKSKISNMSGEYRMPTLLKAADSACREYANKYLINPKS